MRLLLKTIAGALLYYSGLFRLLLLLNRRKVLVLAYHSVTDDADGVPGSAFPHWVLDTHTFFRQMRFVKKHFRSIQSRDMVDYLTSSGTGGPDLVGPMVLSFDDGFENQIANVAPILDTLGLKGVFFAVGRALERGGDSVGFPPSLRGDTRAALPCRYATRRDLRDLVQRGHEVGCHSYDHVRMTTLNDGQLASDVSRSRLMVEQAIRDRAYSFCYPYGLPGTYDARVASVVKSHGFICAFTSVEGMNCPSTDTDLFALKRMPILGSSGFFPFVLQVTGVEMALKRVFARIRS